MLTRPRPWARRGTGRETGRPCGARAGPRGRPPHLGAQRAVAFEEVGADLRLPGHVDVAVGAVAVAADPLQEVGAHGHLGGRGGVRVHRAPTARWCPTRFLGESAGTPAWRSQQTGPMGRRTRGRPAGGWPAAAASAPGPGPGEGSPHKGAGTGPALALPGGSGPDVRPPGLSPAQTPGCGDAREGQTERGLLLPGTPVRLTHTSRGLRGGRGGKAPLALSWGGGGGGEEGEGEQRNKGRFARLRAVPF